MLVPAILYKDQITKEFQKYFYTDDMMYVTGCLDNWCPNIVDCPDDKLFQFAVVDDNKKLIGYIGYTIDFYCSRVYNFGMFSFDRGNISFVKDVFNQLEDLIGKFHRIEWRAISNNPACRGYDNFIKKHNGNKHVLKDAVKDRNGIYHDDIIYEIVSDIHYFI